jgi:hypothetical protein
MSITTGIDPYYKTEALKQQLEAIRCLGDLLADEREQLLPASYRDVVLGIINILVLHDVCPATL